MTSPERRLESSNFLEELTRAFPERRDRIEEATGFWVDEEGRILLRSVMHAVIGHDLLDLVEHGWGSPEAELELVRFLAFVDRMFESPDDAVMDMADTGILEDLAPLPRAASLLPLLAPASAAQLRMYLS
jgi:hypothetical protein